MRELSDIPLSELLNLKGKTAVVTGGAQGLGFAISARLLEAGAYVAMYDIDAEAGKQALESLNIYADRVEFVSCDITDEAAVKNSLASIVEAHGGLDILVNNAGIYPRKALTEMTGDDFKKVMDVNVNGMFYCSRYAAEAMIERNKGGNIVNIASIEGVHPASTGMVAYDTSKAAVIMLTKSLAKELGPHGIRVNAIAPGGIMTRAVTANLGTTTREQKKEELKELKNFMRRMALGRMGRPDEIARVVLFLVSGLADYITGDLIAVDGGYLVS